MLNKSNTAKNPGENWNEKSEKSPILQFQNTLQPQKVDKGV